MSKVNVLDENGKVIARVNYNSNLDFWDGNNHSCGVLGRHKGLTKLKDGRFVLIHGTQYQKERDYAEIISKEQALQEILRSGNEELLEKKKFKELRDLYEQMVEEDEE